MVSLEGIVTKCSLVRPKVVKSVHYSEKKLEWKFREYRDQTMSGNGAATSAVYPQQDDDGNPVNIPDSTQVSKLTSPADYRVWLLHVP